MANPNFGLLNKKEITPEMLEDFSHIGDKEYSAKWGVSRNWVVKNRKKLGILPFNKQCGRGHEFVEGVEVKWCPKGGGHWESVSEFGTVKTRPDGLCAYCKFHSRESALIQYQKTGLSQSRKWKQTDNGKKYLRNTWRKKTAKRKEIYVQWSSEDEQNAYNKFDGRCGYCGTNVEFLKIEFDHFIPVAKGGKTEPSNMIPCCKKCNHGIGGKFDREPLEWLCEKFGKSRGEYLYAYILSTL